MTKLFLLPRHRTRNRWILLGAILILGTFVCMNVFYSFDMLVYAPSLHRPMDPLLVDMPLNNKNNNLAARIAGTNFSCDVILSFDHASTTFNPRFFMEQGPGRPYRVLFKKQLEQDKRTRQRLLKVRFVQYTLASDQAAASCRPIYYHIHKNGGSTMNIKLSDLDDLSPTTHNRITTVDTYYTPREQQLGREPFENQTMTILRQARLAQQRQDQTSMPIFTFLRDPVPRFLSSVGQALKLNKLRSCTKQFDSQKRDTLVLLDCILSKIQEKESFLDEHLEPQIFELYHGIMGLDLNVQVMDLATMDTILVAWLGSSSLDVSRRQTKGMVAGFNLSTALLTSELVDRICRIYEMDVQLLQETNVSSSICRHAH